MAMLMMVGFANKQHIKNPHTGSSCWTPAQSTGTGSSQRVQHRLQHTAQAQTQGPVALSRTCIQALSTLSAKSSTASSLSSPSSTSTNIHDYNADLNVL